MKFVCYCNSFELISRSLKIETESEPEPVQPGATHSPGVGDGAAATLILNLLVASAPITWTIPSRLNEGQTRLFCSASDDDFHNIMNAIFPCSKVSNQHFQRLIYRGTWPVLMQAHFCIHASLRFLSSGSWVASSHTVLREALNSGSQ